jgi:prepilin-type N-terminal cleavage/methylation domain-containing protein
MNQKQSQSTPRGCSLTSSGFSLVEVLLSVSIFALLVAALTGAYLYGEEATMLAGNRARAIMLAEEGVEAVRNFRDPAFSNLSNGTYGLTTTSNQYNLSGASDTDGFFTRAINIATVDDKRKDITSTVTWQQNTQRTGVVSIVTRLTNWIASGFVPLKNLLAYSNGSTNPTYRTYDSTANTFSIENSTATSTNGASFILRSSPKNPEAIMGVVTSAGVLNVMCYNGTNWTQEWSATVGGNSNTRRFDISYETNSGDVIVLYGTNAATTNELAYRTKASGSACGSSGWSSAVNLDPIRTSGIVQWVKMAWDKRSSSNLVAAIWADASYGLSSMIWDGDNWVNEPASALTTTLERVSTSQDSESFDLEYESNSGDLMVVWGILAGTNGTNGVRYNTCTGGASTCTWLAAAATPPTFLDDATNLDISANPNSDEIVFASIGNAGSDLQAGYWSGSAWTNRANLDTSCQAPMAGTKLVSTAWLISGATTRSIVLYNDSGARNIGYYIGNGSTFSAGTDFTVSPLFASPQKYYQAEMNPLNKSELMFCLSDNLNDLSCKRLVMSAVPAFTWTNAAGLLTATLSQAINSPFSFSYLRY